jgi:hypothetical protein
MTSEHASPVLVPQSAPLVATARISASAIAPAASSPAIHASASPPGRSNAARKSCAEGGKAARGPPNADAQLDRKDKAASCPSRRDSIAAAWRSTARSSPSSSRSPSTCRCNAAASSSSIARKPGSSFASSGKLASKVWQKLWIVCTRMAPPGLSITVANSDRARAINPGRSHASPSARRSSLRSPSSIRTHAASRSWMRCAISAAPALVKVMQRIASGETPSSISRSTRADSTCVFPVPAEAPSHTWLSGSAAAPCRASSSARPEGLVMRPPRRARTIRHGASAGRNRHSPRPRPERRAHRRTDRAPRVPRARRRRDRSPLRRS